MVDLDLMTRLLRALSPQASLLLLGDSDQLESVETGGVLAELVARGTKSTLRVEQLHRYRDRMGPDAPTLASDASLTENGKNALPGLVVRLRHSYRAKGAPWILELAALARPGSRGTVAQFSSCCRHYEPHLRRHNLRRTLLTLCAEQWQRAQAKTDGFTMSAPPSDSVLGAHLRRFQLLCGSNAQVAQANRLGVRRLWDASVKHSGLGLPHGCPVLVTQNRATLGLSNGDVGIALGTEPGRAAQVVVFPGLHQPIPIAQLPEHQPAFALTIHKSQGSEWEKVAIDLPDESELLDRNLLYTAITRSSSTLDLYANDRALAAILEPVESM
jgi:exodeoxyribonuclease V alpha subunit